MARKARQTSGTGIYHVMLRGINRQVIFESNADYSYFIRILYRMVYPMDESRHPQPSLCSIYAYCLMPNHVHLLLREKAEALSSVVKRIAAAYAWYYNKRYEHYGHLFQDRFKSEPVNDMGYFVTLLRYIHQNPVAAGLSHDVASYPWSSWGEYDICGAGKSCVCSIGQVVERFPIEELREMVNNPLSKTIQVLDVEEGTRSRSDNEVSDFLKSFGLGKPSDLVLYASGRRNDIISAAREYGATIRQLSRLTGISIGIIRKL